MLVMQYKTPNSPDVIPCGASIDVDNNDTPNRSTSCEFDPNNAGRVLAWWTHFQSGSGQPYAIAGNVSGCGITWGTRENPLGAGYYYNSCAWLHGAGMDDKFIMVFHGDQQAKMGFVVGTVTGTTISFGTPTFVFSTTWETSFIKVVADKQTAGKFAVIFDPLSTYSSGCYIGTVSGTTVSVGSKQSLPANGLSDMSIDYDPFNADKVVLGYADTNDGSDPKVAIGTISGTNITWQTATELDPQPCDQIDVKFDPLVANRFVVAYEDNGSTVRLRLGTVTGNSISVGAEATPVFSNNAPLDIDFDPFAQDRFGFLYTDSVSVGKYITYSISGTDIVIPDFPTDGIKYDPNQHTAQYHGVSFDPNTQGSYVVVWNTPDERIESVVGDRGSP